MHAGNKKQQSETKKKKQVQKCAKIFDHEEQDPGDSRIPGADKYAKCVC
jgi:hypothetical protein